MQISSNLICIHIKDLEGFSLISDVLINNCPLGATIFSNFTKEGWFITTTAVASVTMGELIFLSETITVQFAVPPLISGP